MNNPVMLILTRSQQMALTEILATYMRTDEVQSFIDVLNDTETTTPELLRLVMGER